MASQVLDLEKIFNGFLDRQNKYVLFYLKRLYQECIFADLIPTPCNIKDVLDIISSDHVTELEKERFLRPWRTQSIDLLSSDLKTVAPSHFYPKFAAFQLSMCEALNATHLQGDPEMRTLRELIQGVRLASLMNRPRGSTRS
jgi:hypothetical protein